MSDRKKYGRDKNWEAYARWNYLGSNFDHIGKLLKDKVIEEDQYIDLYPTPMTIHFWETFKPIIKKMRENLGYSEIWMSFEFLYGELKRRFPQI